MAKQSKKQEVMMVLDATGSMSGRREETLEGVNSYVDEVQQKYPKALFTLVVFNSQIGVVTVHDRVKMKDVPALTAEDYVCDGMTPLWDAIGQSVNALDKAGAKKPLVAIMTDGLENHSKEFTADGIKALTEQQKKKGWQFAFLGADPHIVQAGARVVDKTSNIQFDPNQPAVAMLATARATADYFEGNMTSRGFFKGAKSVASYMKKVEEEDEDKEPEITTTS